MELQYKDEYISKDGINYHVLDTTNIDFSSSYVGRKIKPVLIIRANGGEIIRNVSNEGKDESIYITKEGEAIFYVDDEDIYVPTDESGDSWQFDELENHGYELIGRIYPFESNLAVKAVSNTFERILPNVILEPTVIKDAFGSNLHQFLPSDSTLAQNFDSKAITGIDPITFEKNWCILNKDKELNLKINS